jgi:hypothetical protein
MNLKKVLSTIRFTRKDDRHSILIENMPIQTTAIDEQNIRIVFPLLANLFTISRNNQEDIELAVEEALWLFFKTIQSHGNGIRSELKEIGWELKTDSKLRFRISEHSPLNSLMDNVKILGQKNLDIAA